MLRRTGSALLIEANLDQYNPSGPSPKGEVKFEIGKWTRTDEALKQFTDYCAKNHVKSRGRVKVVSTDKYARTLRSTRETQPGDALITMPANKGFNLLSVARRMMDEPNRFSEEITWKNWNLKSPMYLNPTNFSVSDCVTAAWMVRAMNTACPEHGVFMEWILADDTGGKGVKEGIRTGFQGFGGTDPEVKEAQQEQAHFISSAAYDSCEEIEDFEEKYNVALAAYLKRSVLMSEMDQIQRYARGSEFTRMPPVVVAMNHHTTTTAAEIPAAGNTNQQSASNSEVKSIIKGRTTIPGLKSLFLPTIYPLIDCCLQFDYGSSHNCMVDYIPPERLIESNSELFYNLDVKPHEILENSEIQRHGLVALRALCQIPAGDYLSLRAFPKSENSKLEEQQIRNTHAQMDLRNSGKDANYSIQNLSKFGNHE